MGECFFMGEGFGRRESGLLGSVAMDVIHWGAREYYSTHVLIPQGQNENWAGLGGQNVLVFEHAYEPF